MPEIRHGVFGTTAETLGLRGDFKVLDFDFGHTEELLIQRQEMIPVKGT